MTNADRRDRVVSGALFATVVAFAAACLVALVTGRIWPVAASGAVLDGVVIWSVATADPRAVTRHKGTAGQNRSDDRSGVVIHWGHGSDGGGGGGD